jgi:hypothetical protein
VPHDLGCPVGFGLLLAGILLGLGLGTGLRQRRTLRRLREERYMPSDERAYLRGQVRRRLVTSGVLVVLGGMIGGAYLSGMEARADEIAGRQKKAEERKVANPDAPAEHPPPDDADRAFTKFYTWYWIAVLVLVFVVVCLAVLDFWHTRRYWMAQYKRIKEDHETKLRRDLAVYRRQKDEERLGRRGRRRGSPDDTDEHEPVD